MISDHRKQSWRCVNDISKIVLGMVLPEQMTVNCFGGNYPVQMRTSPSIAVGATVAVGHHSTQPAVEAVNSQSVSFVWTGSSYRSIGYRVYQTFTASAEL
jgi:hypothetical protein